MNTERIVARLMAAFRTEQSPESIQVYVEALKVDPPLLERAVEHLINTKTFFPSIGEIRNEAMRIAGIMPPSPGEIASVVQRADVREPVYRRDGSFAYEERYWRYPEGTPRATIQAAEAVLEKVGEPCDQNGKPRFGWETALAKEYERIYPELLEQANLNLSQARLPEGVKHELPSGSGLR